MSSQVSNKKDQASAGTTDDIECIWCGISRRLFPDLDIQWAVVDKDKRVGICTECWNVLPEEDKQLKPATHEDEKGVVE
ncbi:MAG: hypothetical protein N0E54_00540 [Candidatus Thiodiazotropha taylori]|nr:hypothetical protein [Candidatus Thiodiazotropha endolucinida]MCW4227204.1 hypothetical protein [Candidatus Thiodiazotropha taylori]